MKTEDMHTLVGENFALAALYKIGFRRRPSVPTPFLSKYLQKSYKKDSLFGIFNNPFKFSDI